MIKIYFSYNIGENNLAESMPDRTQELSKLLDQFLAYKKLALPSANPQFDPENIPSIRSAKGKGGKKGKGKGRKGKGR